VKVNDKVIYPDSRLLVI